MFIAFLPAAEAHAVLEDEREQEAAASEHEAELGSGFFCGGASSYDATFMARQVMAQAREDFDQSEDAPLYYARLEAARFMTEAITQDVRVHSEEELRDSLFLPVNPVVVPEYYPYDVTGEPVGPYPYADLFGTFALSEDDIPF